MTLATIYTLQGDNGRPRQWRRHRLLCIIFKYPGPTFKDLEVNHINGIKGADWLDNLEWVTTQENSIHAHANDLVVHHKTTRLVSVRDVDTGDVIKYSNVNIGARDIGLSVDALLYRCYIGETKIFPERKQYRASHSDEPWYVPQNIECELMLNGTSKRIHMRNVLTDEILEFDQLQQLAEHLKLSPSVITQWLKAKNQPVLPGFIQLKMAHDLTPWRDVVDPHLELSQRSIGRRVVKVTNMRTGEEKIYLSAVACASEHNLSPTLLNYRLNANGNPTFSDGCKYRYYSELTGPTD